MARTTSIWALAALPTGVLGHIPSKVNSTHTVLPGHSYPHQGPYSSSLVETSYQTPIVIPIKTLPSSEEEPCGTKTRTLFPSGSVSSSYETASSPKPYPLKHEPSISTIYASLPAYHSKVIVESIISTWLPPSYTVAVPFYPSNSVASTWLPPVYTAVIPLPPSSGVQATTSSYSSSSDYQPSAPTSSSVVYSLSRATSKPTFAIPSSSGYATNAPSTSLPSTVTSSLSPSSVTVVISVPLPQTSSSTLGSSIVSSPVALSSATSIFLVPPPETSSIISDNSSSAGSQLSVSASWMPTVPSSTVLGSALTSTVVVPPSSTVAEPSSVLENTSLSTLNPVASTISSKNLSSGTSTSVGTTLQGVTSVPSSSAVVLSSIVSLTVGPESSPETSLYTTRPTAAGSSVHYTLSTSPIRSSAVPAESTTGIPPAPPVQTGGANVLRSSGKKRVWWGSFLLPFIFFT